MTEVNMAKTGPTGASRAFPRVPPCPFCDLRGTGRSMSLLSPSESAALAGGG